MQDIRVGDVVSVVTTDVPMTVERIDGESIFTVWFERRTVLLNEETREYARRWHLRRGRFLAESLDLESRP